jgi:DNA polymerase-3 subunit alpha
VTGIYLSSHPLDDFKLEINTFTTATLADLQNLWNYLDREVIVAEWLRYQKRHHQKQ